MSIDIPELIHDIISNIQENHSVSTQTYVWVDRYFIAALLVDKHITLRFDLIKLNNGTLFNMKHHHIDIITKKDKQFVLDLLNIQLKTTPPTNLIKTHDYYTQKTK